MAAWWWGRRRHRWNQRLVLLLFLAPWLVSFVTFTLYPIAHSFYLSFTKYSPIRGGEPQFVGLANYERILNDPRFWQALKNTVIFVVGTIPVTTTIAVTLAVFLNERIKLRTFFRATYFLPVVTSIVVIATIWTYIYSPLGVLNAFLNLLGLEGRNWLLDVTFALPAIMVMDIWASFGYYTILFLAGLQSIPEELYEAASLDGANAVQRFFRITLPLLRPTLVFALVINTIRSFQIFTEVYVMTQGGPIGATTTLVYYLYNMGFQKFRMGYASALAYVLVLIILVFALVQMRLLRYGERVSDGMG